MNLFQAIILSFVEGITEFLPVSSTGHLILASKVLGIVQTEFVKSFEIFIQLGAILGVVILYKNILIKNKKVLTNIFAAFLPTAMIGLIFYKIIKSYLLGNAFITVITLFAGGIVLIFVEKLLKYKQNLQTEIEKIGFPQSIGIGLIQSLSVVPGVSRSAASIIGGMILGLNKTTAVEFSFLLAIPTVFAATALDLVKSKLSFSLQEIILLAVGFLFSFLFSMFGIKLLIKVTEKYSFAIFGVYRIILALVFYFFLISTSN